METSLVKKLLVYTASALISILMGVSAASASFSPVSLERAEADLRTVVERNSNLEIHAARGRSMKPYFDDNSLLLVRTVKMESLKSGMIVVFRDNDGDMVGHRLERDGKDGLRTRGHANSSADADTLTADNLAGVVVGVFQTRENTAASGRFPVVVGKTR